VQRNLNGPHLRFTKHATAGAIHFCAHFVATAQHSCVVKIDLLKNM